MSALDFIAAVAWPLTVLVIAIMFRRPITTALASAAGHLKAGPFELAWEETISEVEVDLGQPPSVSKGEIGGAAGKLDELAEESPVAAVVQTYGQIELALRDLLKRHGVDGVDDQWHVVELARHALRKGLITPETMKAVEGLSVLRNLAAHGRDSDLSTQRAHEFVALAQGTLFAINAGA